MANTTGLTKPPQLAWQSMPREFALWFELNWKALVANLAAIQGVDSSVTTLSGSVNLATTNLGTLQTQANAISAAQLADAAAILVLQGRATTDETAIAGKLTAASNLSDVANAATARTNLGLGSGVSGTITIPKLTTSNGSITVVNGIITAFVNPT